MDIETIAVEKTVVIERSQADTFRMFTEEFGSWWPVATHSIHSDNVATAVLERREGGRLYERTMDGEEYEWGTILEWDAPDGFTVLWKPNLDPDAHRTTWMIRFEAIDSATTRIDLIHTGWEGFGESAAETASIYETGWDLVLGALAAAI